MYDLYVGGVGVGMKTSTAAQLDHAQTCGTIRNAVS